MGLGCERQEEAELAPEDSGERRMVLSRGRTGSSLCFRKTPQEGQDWRLGDWEEAGQDPGQRRMKGRPGQGVL